MLHFLNIITIYLKYEFLHLLNNFSSMPFAQLKNKLTTQTYRAGFLALNYCVTILFNIFIGHIKSLIPLIISIESVRNPNNGDHSHFQEDGKVSEQIATSFKKSVFSEFQEHASLSKNFILCCNAWPIYWLYAICILCILKANGNLIAITQNWEIFVGWKGYAT